MLWWKKSIFFRCFSTKLHQTHKCSAESVDEGLSFSSGGLSSNTMVSVLARQNPLDLMISEKYKDTWSALMSAWSVEMKRGSTYQTTAPPTWYLDWTLNARLDSVHFVVPQHLVQRRALEEGQHHLWPGILSGPEKKPDHQKVEKIFLNGWTRRKADLERHVDRILQ